MIDTQPLPLYSLHHPSPVIYILYISLSGLAHVVEPLNEEPLLFPYEGRVLIYKLNIGEKAKIMFINHMYACASIISIYKGVTVWSGND